MKLIRIIKRIISAPPKMILNSKMTFKIIVLFLAVLVISGFKVIRLKRLLIDGEIRKEYMLDKSESCIECTWEGDSTYAYRISVHTTLRGKGFLVNPDSLCILTTNSNISIIPVKERGKSFGESAWISTCYVLFGKKEKYVKQMFDIVYRTKNNNDTLCFYIVPSNYILYKDYPVIKDTLRLTFPICSD